MTKAEIEKKIRTEYATQIQNHENIERIDLADVIGIIADIFGKQKPLKADYWKTLVDEFFVWHKSKYGFNPDFKGAVPKDLKQLIDRLKTVAKENKIEWTEKNAAGYLRKILNLAYQDVWLKKNFSIRNINLQYSRLRANEHSKKIGHSKQHGRINSSDIAEYLSRRNV